MPTSMFDRYEVAIEGFASGPALTIMYCNVYFLEPVPYGTQCDTIPILVLDSLIFSGPCFRTPLVMAFEVREKPGNYGEYNRKQEPAVPYEDLFVRNGVLVPVGFSIPAIENLPFSCNSTGFTIHVSGHLVDRKSHYVVGRETASIEFYAHEEPAG